MNRLQAALLEHDFVIQYKKGAIMPADYLSRLPSTNENQLAEVTQCFDPFQWELIDLQKADPDLQKCIILELKVNGRLMSQKQMVTIYKIWLQNFIKMQTSWYGSDLMTTNTQEQLYFYQKYSGNWHSARLTITSLGVTMQP